MKVRSGFVSNSSSSSFIIAVKNNDTKCHYCGRSDFDLIDAIENSCDYDSEVVHRNFDEIIFNIKNEITFLQESLKTSKFPEHIKEDIKKQQKIIDKIENYKNNNYACVFQIRINYHNKLLNDLLNNCRNSGKIDVIDEWN